MLSYRPSFATVFSASSRVVLPIASLLVWGAVAFSAVTWGLRWSATGTNPSNTTAAAQALPEVDVSAAARSLGAAPVQAAAAPTLASRFQLQGVMAGGPDAGAALIAVDGKPAKPSVWALWWLMVWCCSQQKGDASAWARRWTGRKLCCWSCQLRSNQPIKHSAEIPKPVCSLRTMLMVSGRLRFKIS